MAFSSWLRFLSKRKTSPVVRRKATARPRHRLALERLEERELLATAPSIVSFTPADRSTPGTNPPTLSVTFNEDVTGANVASNYKLFDSSGNSIPINVANYSNGGGSGPFVATLTYNSGSPLVVDTYTLFVRAGQIADASGSGLTLGVPGQVVVANSSSNTISTLSLPNSGTLGGLSDYALPPKSSTQANPAATVLADLTGDGIPDLVIIDSATNTLNVFAGQTGGSYNLAPDLSVDLTSGSGAKAVVAADLNNDGKLDLIVANTSLGSVSVYLNGRVNVGDLTLSAAVTTSTGTSSAPVGLAVADFNGDGFNDVAVANSGTATDLNADSVNDYYITILPGSAGGALGTATNIKIGDVTPTAFTAPTGIATGLLDGDNKPDLAVSGPGGVLIMTNTSTTNTFSFTQTQSAITTATTSVAIGVVRTSTSTPNQRGDIVATTSSNSGQVLILINGDNAGTFTALSGIAAGGTPTSVQIGDLNNDGFNDIVVANTLSPGQVTVLRNLSRTGAINTASNGSPITIDSTNHGLLNNDQVYIRGVTGNNAANGFFTITNVSTNTFDLTGTTGTGSGTGGTWTALYFGIGSGAISNTSNTAGQPITVTSRNHGLLDGQQVTVKNVAGAAGSGANGTFFVKVVDRDNFILLGSTPSGAYTTGGTWALTPYGTDPNPVAIALGDTNQDGNLDVVTANGTSKTFSVLRGNGDTSFQLATTLSVSPATQPDAVATGDLNGDGLPDVVVADYSSNQVTVFLAQAGGGYQTPASYSVLSGTVGRNPVSLALADLTGTGKLDIIAASQRDNLVTILQNSGTGTFSLSGTAATGQTPTQVVVGDFNNDGKLDLAVSHNRQGGGGGGGGGGFGNRQGVTILLGNGNRTFQAGKEFATTVRASAVGVGDFNKDGKVDFVVADNNAPGHVGLYLGDGTGANFTAAGSFTVGNNPVGLVVADFNADGFLDVATISSSSNTTDNVSVLLNSAGSGFQPEIATSVGLGVPLQSLAIANVNADPFPDLIFTTAPRTISGATNAGPIVITSNGHGLSTGNVVTISGVKGNTAANGTWTITVVDNNRFSLNGSTGNAAYTSGTGVWALSQDAAYNNVFTLQATGHGDFLTPVPYQAGGVSGLTPSYVAVVSDPFRRVTTFTTGGTTVSANLILNGNFESRDLATEQGNLDGWNTYNSPAGNGSHGAFLPQTGTTSPLSLVTVPASANGKYQAMLDQEDQIPVQKSGGGFGGGGGGGGTTTNNNTPDSYQGTHLLYQDIAVPNGLSKLSVAFTLYIDNTNAGNAGYSDTTVNSSLDFNTAAANQQVRVDIMDPSAALLDTGSGVLQNLFVTAPANAATQTVTITANLSVAAYQNKTIRLRFAAANNQGKLIVGVDNVKLQATFSDSAAPTLTGLQIRNPSVLASPSLADPTTDPTIVGRVNDNGTVNNIAFVAFDLTGAGFSVPNLPKVTNFDATGAFSFSPDPSLLLPGLNTVNIEVVDKAGNVTTKSITFTIQGPSIQNWASQGPGAINVASAGVNYTTVSGDITAVAADPRDTSGNTYYVGTSNGGVWKTSDGGNDWHVLTDSVFDASGVPIAPSIGGLGIGIVNTTSTGTPATVLYAATGLAANAANAHLGQGVLVSIDDGITWSVTGQAQMTGARVSKLAVSPTDPNTAYVAVTAFSDGVRGPAVFRTKDAGKNWTNVLDPTKMFAPGHGAALGAGTALASVTDLIIDPFNPQRILIGLGNIGEAASSATAGLWLSIDGGDSWTKIIGGDDSNIAANTLPQGTGVGRVTLAIGNGRVGDEKYVYVLIGNPPPTASAGVYDQGTSIGTNTGLYKTKDNLLNFTKVMLKQDIGSQNAESFVDINLLGHEATDVGALLVDQNDPNVVYVGGSSRFLQSGDTNPAHGVIRVDTGNMRDTTYVDPGTGKIPNDGDDITKAFTAANPSANSPRTAGFYYDGGANTNKYVGEGVYWYDIQQGSASKNGNQNNLPGSINDLAFDPQGRLLIGTIAGLWRGIPLGFGYDYSSGGTGIMGGKPPSVPGIKLTALNGNLAISDLTGVAVDTANPGTFYTSEFGTGTAVSTSGLLGWLSSGLTGPTDPTTGNNLNIPNAAAILSSVPNPLDPNAATTVFRVWEYAKTNALVPEQSSDGGQTFGAVASSGISVNERAGDLPALAVNTKKVLVNGVAQDELLLGGQRVYHTATGGNAWDQISPILDSNAFITALAFAPSNPGVYYAGTDRGEVFVQTPGGNWPNSSTGLPGTPGSATAPRVNGLAVDPTNGAVAFALLGGGTGIAHVYKTINGGASWSAANALAGGGLLPDVAAYSMVIDATPSVGAPNGRYYLGTGVGVYISYDKGQTWVRFGKGLPNVPVVNLVLDSVNEVLAVATQGRGVFTISTRLDGPQVVSVTPTNPTSQPLSQMTVTFNEGVDVRTFSTNANVAARTVLVNSVLFSDTYRTARVAQLYQLYLRRSPAPGEDTSFIFNTLKTKGDDAAVAALVSSGEYFSNPTLGNNDNATWVNSVYNDLLHRTAVGDSGAAAFITAVNAAPAAQQPGLRVQFVTNLVANDEYHANLIVAAFNQYLGRNKPLPAHLDDPETITWLNLFHQGATYETLEESLLGSQENYTANDGLFGVGAGAAPSAVALANLANRTDSNGTAFNDLIVVDAGLNQVKIFQGKAGGGYDATPTVVLTLPSGANPTAIAVADFNGDNLPDIAVSNSGTDNVTVFRNTSSGGVISFASNTGTNVSTGAGTGPVAIVAGKFHTAAGNTDLAVLAGKKVSGKYNLIVLTGNGSGGFSLGATVDTGLTVQPTGLAAGDVNGDNIQDFVVTGNDGATTPTGSVRFLRATNTSLAYSVSTLTATASTSATIGKVDNGTTNDVVVTTATGNVLVFQNQGGTTPVFSSPFTFNVGGSPRAVMLADLNGDGLNDILAVNATTIGSLDVLKNTTVKATSGFDTITFGNVAAYPIPGAMPVALARGDTNQDLVPDVALVLSQSDQAYVMNGTQLGGFLTATDERFIISMGRRLLLKTLDAGTIQAYDASLGALEQSRLTGPGGNTVPLSITDIDPTNHRTFQLVFAPQTLDGTYTLTIGPNASKLDIKDFVDVNGTYASTGNPMNQNANLANGEFPGDRFAGNFAINTSDDGAFVSGLYHDLLGNDPTGRAADTNGFIGFNSVVDAGRNAAIAAISPNYFESGEYRSNVVAGYFVTYLRRSSPPTPSDVSGLVSMINNGQITEEGIIAALVASDEYYNNSALGNGDRATWLTQAYKDLLGRDTTGDATAAAYLNSLNFATDAQLPSIRLTIANDIVATDEFLKRVIFADYTSLLGRAPQDSTDPAQSEYQFWLPTLRKTTFTAGGMTPDEQVRNVIVDSTEYFQHVGNTDAGWSASIFTKVLGRSSVTTTDVNTLLAGLLSTYAPSLQTAAKGIATSSEHLARVVAGYYSTFLGRTGSAAEISGYVSQMVAGSSDEFIAAQFLSSNEYYPTSGPGSANSGWLDKVYQQLLFHGSNTGSDSTAAGYLSALNNGTMTRVQVAQAILTSNEYRRILVAQFFNKYLGRNKPIPPSASDSELTPWVNKLAAGESQEQLIAELLASVEYFLRSHTFP